MERSEMFCTTVDATIQHKPNKFKKRVLQINSLPRHDHKHIVGSCARPPTTTMSSVKLLCYIPFF